MTLSVGETFSAEREAMKSEGTGQCLLSRENSYINRAFRSPNKTAVTIGLRRCHNGRAEGWLYSSGNSSDLKGWVLADGAIGRVCVP